MTIAQMNRNWAKLDLASEASWVMLNNREAIVEYNREQLSEGMRSDMTPIRPVYRSEWYANMKQGMNNKPKKFTPDLKLTGSFYDGFVIKMQGYNKYSVSSIDSKTNSLVNDYRITIFGFTPRSKQMITELIMQSALIERLKTKLFQ